MGILKFIAFCAQIDFFGLRVSTRESQRADTFCITMVDYKIHFQKMSALTTCKTEIIFHVESRCYLEGFDQVED